MEGEPIDIRVQGMTCGHCEASVREALERLEGVTVISVDRVAGIARLTSFDPETTEAALAAIRSIGFDASA
jgi:copper chaperone CopZ